MLAARCRFSSVPSPRLVRAPMCTYCSTLLLSRDSSVLFVPPPPLSHRTLSPPSVALPSRHSRRVACDFLSLSLVRPVTRAVCRVYVAECTNTPNRLPRESTVLHLFLFTPLLRPSPPCRRSTTNPSSHLCRFRGIYFFSF